MITEDKSLLKEGKVLIDFWAEWCSPCRIMKPTVRGFAESHPDVNVYFCNVDEDSEMAAAFGVRSIPTLVYLEDGEVKGRKVGNVPPAIIEEMVNFGA